MPVRRGEFSGRQRVKRGGKGRRKDARRTQEGRLTGGNQPALPRAAPRHELPRLRARCRSTCRRLQHVFERWNGGAARGNCNCFNAGNACVRVSPAILMSSSARLTSSARLPLLLCGANSADDAVITYLQRNAQKIKQQPTARDSTVAALARAAHMMTSGKNSVWRYSVTRSWYIANANCRREA